jgi:hypothetical protein
MKGKTENKRFYVLVFVAQDQLALLCLGHAPLHPEKQKQLIILCLTGFGQISTRKKK